MAGNFPSSASRTFEQLLYYSQENKRSFVLGNRQGESCAMLGPVAAPTGMEQTEKFFPVSMEYPVIASAPQQIPNKFIPKLQNIFRGEPTQEPKIHDPYIQWLERLEGTKAETWKEMGIFECIQLSRNPTRLYKPLLVAAFLFWSQTTNTFHVPGGMLTPTLLDMSVLTHLRPQGILISSNFVAEQSYLVNFNPATYSHFIEHNRGAPDAPVTDQEHVAFLAIWLNRYVFCSKSAQMLKKYLPLASIIHEDVEGRLSLSKLVLASLYDTLSEACTKIRQGSLDNLGGPLWILQMWLIQLFNRYFYKPVEMDDSLPIGQRLQMYEFPEVEGFEEELNFFLGLFNQLTTENLIYRMPILHREDGPEWLRGPLVRNNGELNPVSIEIWHHVMVPQLLTPSFPGSKEIETQVYNPHCVALQFGMIQGIPFPISRERSTIGWTFNSESEYLNTAQQIVENTVFEPVDIIEVHSIGIRFALWWTRVSECVNLEELRLRLAYCLQGTRENCTPLTKGKNLNMDASRFCLCEKTCLPFCFISMFFQKKKNGKQYVGWTHCFQLLKGGYLIHL